MKHQLYTLINLTSFYGRLLFLFILLACLYGCNNESQDEDSITGLFKKEKNLSCLLESMKDSIKTEWDDITILLDEKLPEDMPAEEKANMLKVRNANLIRMFQSFETVDDEVKMALKETEMLDREMTKRITLKKKEIQKIESEKMTLFQQVEKEKGPEELQRIKNLHQKILAENCE